MTKSRAKQDQDDLDLSHSDFKKASFASLKPAPQDRSVGNPTTSNASKNPSQASTGAHYIRDSSYGGTKQAPQLSPQSSGKETSNAYSLTNNLDAPYFATTSWSFTPPVPSSTEVVTPTNPTSTFYETPGLGAKGSASANMTTASSSSLSRGPRLHPRSITTELTDDEDSPDENDLALWMVQDAEDEMSRSSLANSGSKVASSRRSSTVIPRNLAITSPFVKLDKFTYNGISLAEKVYVELEDKDFLRIVHIVQDTSTSAVTLRGWKFRRTRELNGVIDRKLNEVCWILHIDDDDPRDAKLQGMETVPVHNVVKRRRIRLTNQSFPALSWRDDGKKEKPETIENDRVLVCRFKYLCFYANAKARTAYEWHEKGFHRLREDECDQRPDNNMKDEELRNVWRGYTVHGGMQEGWLPGEREFLRQEDVSHRGITSRASLKAPSGPDFPMGDPMKRGSVGSLVTEHGLQQNSDRAMQSIKLGSNDLVHTKTATKSNDDVEGALISSISRSREQRQDGGESNFNFSGFNGIPIISSDCDTHDEDAIFALRRGLRQSSIGLRKPSDRSPRIVEIDAHVKTSSSSGTFEKRYEGRVTSRYYLTPRLAQRKRSADISLGSPTRPTKRVDQGFRAESSKADVRNKHGGQDSRTLSGKMRYSHRESVALDNDRTLGRSQSPDSVEEMYTPSKIEAYKTPISGLPAPVLRRKDSAPRLSSDITPPLRMNGLMEYHQPSMPLSRTSPSSVANKTHTYVTIEDDDDDDDDDIIDLTRPQANTIENFSYTRPSLVHQPGAGSVLYSHLNETTSSKEKSFRPATAHPPFNSKSYATLTGTRQKLSSISPGSLLVTPGSSLASRMPSPPNYRATASPSSRRTEKSRQQNQHITIKSPASKASQRRYTFGDCFCGAGGMSRGAVSAGLRVHWGFDFNLKACQSYQMNFFRTPIYNVWADQFSEAKGNHKVDICHLSPPCQFFSDAHTVQGKDDDMNTASLFAIFNLLDKAKPRVVTLEQTSGIIRRHTIFFNAVINMFNSRGFSVRWKVINCADFGLPQRRTRLFVIASW